MDKPRPTLLVPGHEATWARINDEDRQRAIPAVNTPIETLLRSGMALTEQASVLLNAIERPGAGRPASGP